jgi:hypothetical protein
MLPPPAHTPQGRRPGTPGMQPAQPLLATQTLARRAVALPPPEPLPVVAVVPRRRLGHDAVALLPAIAPPPPRAAPIDGSRRTGPLRAGLAYVVTIPVLELLDSAVATELTQGGRNVLVVPFVVLNQLDRRLKARALAKDLHYRLSGWRRWMLEHASEPGLKMQMRREMSVAADGGAGGIEEENHPREAAVYFHEHRAALIKAVGEGGRPVKEVVLVVADDDVPAELDRGVRTVSLRSVLCGAVVARSPVMAPSDPKQADSGGAAP